MTAGSERIGVGRRFFYDGLIVTIAEIKYGAVGVEVVVVDSAGKVRRIALRELLDDARARLIPTDAGPARGCRTRIDDLLYRSAIPFYRTRGQAARMAALGYFDAH
jgi:hypothetical protein